MIVEVVKTTDILLTRTSPSPEAIVLKVDGKEVLRLPPGAALELAHRIIIAAFDEVRDEQRPRDKHCDYPGNATCRPPQSP